MALAIEVDKREGARFNKRLSLKLDECIALLDVAVSPGLRAIIAQRKANIEARIFDGDVGYEPGERLDPRAWEVVRKAVLDRDGYICQGCAADDRPLEVHHIVPIQRGGSNEMSNLNTLCDRCHKRIHPWLYELDAEELPF